ncbi:MAG: cupin domain-containing protein [Magnetospirillum sp. WYHS-4]
MLSENAADWPPHDRLLSPATPFVDERGSIQPVLDRGLGSVVVIASKAGAVRANHYHRTDWHYCYVLSGRIEYWHRPTGSARAPESLVLRAGQMVFTPPMLDHAMVFPEDTVFLTLGRGHRDPVSYENDIVKVELVGPDGRLRP